MRTPETTMERCGCERADGGGRGIRRPALWLATTALSAMLLCAAAPSAHAVSATGGSATNSYTENGTNFVAHVFTEDGDFTVTSGGDVQVLCVGGGGSGAQGVSGSHYGAGGAGGTVRISNLTVSAQAYTVTVGAGGTYDTGNSIGGTGGSSSFSTLVEATGGSGTNDASRIGGSNADHVGGDSTGGAGSAGGGGAGAGFDGSTYDGGDGLPCSFAAGTNRYYGGGGPSIYSSGGRQSGDPGLGGAGTYVQGDSSKWPGKANTGGGACGVFDESPAAGGSGIVIVRYEYVEADPSYPEIATLAPTNVTTASARMRGTLTAIGEGASEAWVAVFWGDNDGGDVTNAADGVWDRTNWFPSAYSTAPADLATNMTLDLGAAEYFYRFAATNLNGWGQSGSQWFIASNLWVTASGSAAEPADPAATATPGTFTVHRASAATSRQVTVSFEYSTGGGYAAYTTDYTLSPLGSVTLPAGVASSNILVYPVFDTDSEEDEKVGITITADPTVYPVGGSDYAEMLITDIVVTGADQDSIINPASLSSLGTLSGTNGSITIDTDARTITGTLDSASVSFTGTNVYSESGNVRIGAFCFDEVDLAATVAITVTGNQALALLAMGDLTLGADLVVTGQTAAAYDDPPGVGGTGASGGSGTNAPPPSNRGQGGDPGRDTAGGTGVGLGGGVGGSGNYSGGGGGGHANAGGMGGNTGAGAGGGDYSVPELTNLYGGSGGGGGRKFNAEGACPGGGGGGAILLSANGTITINGTLSAAGGTGSRYLYEGSGGGGSGGAILLAASEISLGGAAVVSVAGGDGADVEPNKSGPGGGGSGGRIAFYAGGDWTATPPDYTNAPAGYESQILIDGGAAGIVVDGDGSGDGAAGGSGTFYVGSQPDWTKPSGTIFLFR